MGASDLKQYAEMRLEAKHVLHAFPFLEKNWADIQNERQQVIPIRTKNVNNDTLQL